MKKTLLLIAILFATLSCKTGTPVSGEVFVVTNGDGIYKPGAAPVSILRRKDLERRFSLLKSSLLKTLGELDRGLDACLDSVSRVSESRQEPFARQCRAANESDFGVKLRKVIDDEIEILATTRTNSEGQFTLILPENGDFVIISQALRTAGDFEEIYFFYHPMTVDGNPVSEVVSNLSILDIERFRSLLAELE